MMDTVKWIYIGISFFFVIYLIGYSTFLFISVVVGSVKLYTQRRKEQMKNSLDRDYFIPVSIVIPAYNEEVTVAQTVRSLLALDYPLYEIIVVDDGSSDQTSEVLTMEFGLWDLNRPVRMQLPCQPVEYIRKTISEKVPITLVRKKNGGKADALNMGINISKYPYFICMDADSALQSDSLRQIVHPILENSRVVAVGGAVCPSNGVAIKNGQVIKYSMPKNLLASMQVLEYDRSFLASRIFFDQFNGNIIISGAFGLFQKEMVIACGGYDTGTMGEDMELVVKLHVFCRNNMIPYRIGYVPDAVCWSQAPENLRDLMKQRRRWHIGLLQSMWKYRKIFANIKYGVISFGSYLYFLFYELLSPLIEGLGVFSVIMAWYLELLNVPFMVLFFLIYAVFGAILSLTAFIAKNQTLNEEITFRDLIKAVLLCFVEVVFLRFVLVWVRLAAIFTYRKQKNSWGKIKREKMNVN